VLRIPNNYLYPILGAVDGIPLHQHTTLGLPWPHLLTGENLLGRAPQLRLLFVLLPLGKNVIPASSSSIKSTSPGRRPGGHGYHYPRWFLDVMMMGLLSRWSP